MATHDMPLASIELDGFAPSLTSDHVMPTASAELSASVPKLRGRAADWRPWGIGGSQTTGKGIGGPDGPTPNDDQRDPCRFGSSPDLPPGMPDDDPRNPVEPDPDDPDDPEPGGPDPDQPYSPDNPHPDPWHPWSPSDRYLRLRECGGSTTDLWIRENHACAILNVVPCDMRGIVIQLESSIGVPDKCYEVMDEVSSDPDGTIVTHRIIGQISRCGFKLSDCDGQKSPIYTRDDWSDYENSHVKLKNEGDTCWLVEEADTCGESLSSPELDSSTPEGGYESCDECKPAACTYESTDEGPSSLSIAPNVTEVSGGGTYSVECDHVENCTGRTFDSIGSETWSREDVCKWGSGSRSETCVNNAVLDGPGEDTLYFDFSNDRWVIDISFQGSTDPCSSNKDDRARYEKTTGRDYPFGTYTPTSELTFTGNGTIEVS